MSGILGLFQTDGRAAPAAVLARMLDTLAHRGPDGSTTWVEGGVGLAHAALRLAPEAPVVARSLVGSEGAVLTADLRLDNRGDLVETLGLESGSPDEELVLRAYARWGEAAPEELEGDFAFALWDAKKRRLFCARDAIGARSFYYFWGGGSFVFASEIKALLAHGGVPRELDEEKIADYLGQVFVDTESTFYRAIRRLPPGHSLTVTEDGPVSRRYWSLDPELTVELPSDEAYAERFRELLTEALACRLRTDRRPAVLLSGGLDSSALVALARQNRDRLGHSPLTTISAEFPDFPSIDERQFIDTVLADGHLEPSFVSASAVSPLGEVERMLAFEDEPFYSPNLFVYWALAEKAKSLGVRVLIDGVDGDTTVCHGLELLSELLRGGRWLRAVREARALGQRFGRPARRFLWHFGFEPAFVRPLIASGAGLFGRAAPPPPATVHPDFAERIGWRARLEGLIADRLRPARTLREHHWRALTSALVPHYLEVNDKASAAFGLDHRHPYFDRRLISFCYGTPPEQKLAGGWDRVIQRRALEGILPDAIRSRVQKSYWGRQFKRGFLIKDADRIRELLAHPGALDSYVNVEALSEAFANGAEGRIGAEDGMNLWLAVTLGLWLRNST